MTFLREDKVLLILQKPNRKIITTCLTVNIVVNKFGKEYVTLTESSKSYITHNRFKLINWHFEIMPHLPIENV